MTSPRHLADGFPQHTRADWRAAALKRTAPDVVDAAERSLASPARNAKPVHGRPPGTPWRIVERVDSGDAPAVVRAVESALAGGATGIELQLPGSLHPLPQRIDATPAAIASRLSPIMAGGALRIEAGSPTPDVLSPFLDLASHSDAELVWAFDPVAAVATGRTIRVDAETVRAAAVAYTERGVRGPVLVADGRLWHAGGATEEQELGIAIATYAHHVRLLGDAERVAIALAVDSDQFRGIAKLRAIRLLVARIMEVAGLPQPALRVHAETAWRTLGGRDADTNIVRATAAAFAAAVGGADSLTVLPFDAAADKPVNGAARLARNVQIILAEEAHVGRVADPAAGSDAIESLTASFAEAAWRRFQSLEAEGGVLAAIADGAILREVAEAREARLARVARGDIRLVGVNAFRDGSGTATVKRAPVKRTGPLTFKRVASPFEDLP